MSDVSRSSYIEFFETPAGRLIFRTPQYNNAIPIVNASRGNTTTVKEAKKPSSKGTNEGILANTRKQAEKEIQSVFDKVSIEERNMLTSDDIIPIDISYGQATENIQSKLQLGFGADLIGLPISIMRYHYTNGKVLSQYGLRMSSVDFNPNVRFSPINDKRTGRVASSLFLKGMFAYARFFLEYMNMSTLTGQIACVGDPKIQAGRTYFDIQNHKFGYINSVTKTLKVGGTYTASFTMMGVRDAVYAGIQIGDEKPRRVEFRILPTLEGVMAQFAKNADAPTPSMNQQLITPPSKQGINPFDVTIEAEGFKRPVIISVEDETDPTLVDPNTLQIDNLDDIPTLPPPTP